MNRRPNDLSLQQCYEALGLEAGVDLETLKSAYRRRAFELHPDLHPDNPQAGLEFQVVNEAYVVLANILRPARPESDDKAHERREGARHDGGERHERRAAHAAYAKEEDVLRDLLNDPFARRVFEDIYAQMQDAEAPPPPPQSDSDEKNSSQAYSEAELVREDFNLDFGQGIGKAVTNWMRKQIDEEQTFRLSPALLRPGARIRLQIRRGMSDEVSTVEIRLPQDFTTDKPVRLKGMGRRIGRWQGDLYLKLTAKV
ncbi:MAG: DnaJ domain-containing protein [Deltaproteobacteria bacterium]|jgi:molecular chaperone DnaJ|nr:DnaJ domain-containing protein [Deltaproteobacteria bacterium]